MRGTENLTLVENFIKMIYTTPFIILNSCLVVFTGIPAKITKDYIKYF